MASASQAWDRTVSDARGNVQVHVAHAGWRGAPVQSGYGGEIGRHFSVRRTKAWRAGILRDQWSGLVGSGKGRQSRGVDRRGRLVARCGAARADPVEVPDS